MSVSKINRSGAEGTAIPATNRNRTRSGRYLDLVQAVPRGEVLAIDGFGPGVATPEARWLGETLLGLPNQDLVSFDWSVPNFDFGHMLDRQNSDWIGQASFDCLAQEGYDRLSRGELLLPHPSCAYLFHCVEDDYDYDRTYCLLVEQDKQAFTGFIFIWQDAPVGSGWRNRWVMDCASFTLEFDELTLRYAIDRPEASQEALDMLATRTEMTVQDFVVATMLLMSPAKLAQTDRKRSVRVDLYNQRNRHGGNRIASPTLVHISRTRVQNSTRTSSVSGAPKAGHVRRAHTRVLWRGSEKERVVQVKASEVNGGKRMQPYIVLK